MKMTMHIDEDILEEVMKITGVASKTKAVEVALSEMVRKHRLKAILKAGLGLTSEELKNSFNYPEEESLRVAEDPPAYGSKHGKSPRRR